MKFFKLFTKFHNEEDGAVTVDWVVLTAAVVALGAAALFAIKGATSKITGEITGFMNSQSVTSTF